MNKEEPKKLHPFRCETCNYFFKHIFACQISNRDLTPGGIEDISFVGCASYKPIKTVKCHTCNKPVDTPMCTQCYKNNVANNRQQACHELIDIIITHIQKTAFRNPLPPYDYCDGGMVEYLKTLRGDKNE